MYPTAVSFRSVCLVSLIVFLPTPTEQISREDIVHRHDEERETWLTAEDFACAAEQDDEVDLRTLGIDVADDPTLGRYPEGDIVSSPASISRARRAATTFPTAKWPKNAKGEVEVPYTMSSNYGKYRKAMIASAITAYQTRTCVRLVPRKDEADYVYITPLDDCHSNIGRGGGKQNLSLAEGCLQVGTILHEMMHALGFFHEQARPDRDDFVTILTDNIKDGLEEQFKSHPKEVIDTLDLPYDFGSIMHYGQYAYGKPDPEDGSKNLMTIKTNPASQQDKIGQRVGLSDLDVQKISKFYDCPIPKKANMARASSLQTAGRDEPDPCENPATMSKCIQLQSAEKNRPDPCDNPATIRDCIEI